MFRLILSICLLVCSVAVYSTDPWHEVIDTTPVEDVSLNIYTPPSGQVIDTVALDAVNTLFLNVINAFSIDGYILQDTAWDVCACFTTIMADRLSRIKNVIVHGVSSLRGTLNTGVDIAHAIVIFQISNVFLYADQYGVFSIQTLLRNVFYSSAAWDLSNIFSRDEGDLALSRFMNIQDFVKSLYFKQNPSLTGGRPTEISTLGAEIYSIRYHDFILNKIREYDITENVAELKRFASSSAETVLILINSQLQELHSLRPSTLLARLRQIRSNCEALSLKLPK